MHKSQGPHKSSEIDITNALRLVLEAGNFDPAAQDVLDRAITEIESLRDICQGLAEQVATLQERTAILEARIDSLQAANIDQLRQLEQQTDTDRANDR